MVQMARHEDDSDMDCKDADGAHGAPASDSRDNDIDTYRKGSVATSEEQQSETFKEYEDHLNRIEQGNMESFLPVMSCIVSYMTHQVECMDTSETVSTVSTRARALMRPLIIKMQQINASSHAETNDAANIGLFGLFRIPVSVCVFIPVITSGAPPHVRACLHGLCLASDVSKSMKVLSTGILMYFSADMVYKATLCSMMAIHLYAM